MKAVVMLQNAWSPVYAGKTWPRHSWLDALRQSRSGQRLRVLENNCHDVELWYDNTTPIVGATPDSVVPPSTRHIKQVLRAQQPDVLVGLGHQAAKALRPVTAIPLMILPHPACRVVTNELYKLAGLFLIAGFAGIVEFKQERGKIDIRYH